MQEIFNFGGLFKKVRAGDCRLDYAGRTAIKTSSGYKVYDLEKKLLINCSSFCLDIGDEMFFVIPTSNVEIGDIIIVNDLPCVVVKVNKDSIAVINYETSIRETVIPERHVFMGKQYFYGKVVSLIGNCFNTGDNDDDENNGFANIIKFKMIAKMLGGKKKTDTEGEEDGLFGDMNGLGALLLMQGGNGIFGNMFNGLFGKKKKNNIIVEEAEDEDEDDIEEDEGPDPEEPEIPEEDEKIVKKPTTKKTAKKTVKKTTKKATKKEIK